MKQIVIFLAVMALAVSCKYDYKTTSGHTESNLNAYAAQHFTNEVLGGLQLIDLLTVANDVNTGKIPAGPGGNYGSNTIRHYSDALLDINGEELDTRGVSLYSNGAVWKLPYMTVECLNPADSLFRICRKDYDSVLEVSLSRPSDSTYLHVFKYSGSDPEPSGRYTARWTSEGECTLNGMDTPSHMSARYYEYYDPFRSLYVFDEQTGRVEYLISGFFRADIYNGGEVSDWCQIDFSSSGIDYDSSLSN